MILGSVLEGHDGADRNLVGQPGPCDFARLSAGEIAMSAIFISVSLTADSKETVTKEFSDQVWRPNHVVVLTPLPHPASISTSTNASLFFQAFPTPRSGLGAL